MEIFFQIFCSQWLSENQIVFGTKCNQLQVYDISSRQILCIPVLCGRGNYARVSENQSGIHAIEINPSRTKLATAAQNSNDIAVYKLPTLDPLCIGMHSHGERIFDMCWIDDQFLLSGSRDKTVALWKVDVENENIADEESYPSYGEIESICTKRCQTADKVRSVLFNAKTSEIVTLSLNGLLHTWDPCRLVQIKHLRLPHPQESVCLATNSTMNMYAVGSKSHVTIIDPTTLKYTKQVIGFLRKYLYSVCFRIEIIFEVVFLLSKKFYISFFYI